MKRYKFIFVIYITSLCGGLCTSKAETKLIENTYLNAMWMGNLNVSTDLDFAWQGMGYSLQYGNNFSSQFATQLNFGQSFLGENMLTNISVDFLWNLTNAISDREGRRASFSPFAAFGVAINRVGEATYSYPMVEIGAQIKYILSDAVDIIIEGRVGGGYDRRDPLFMNINAIKLGASYKFNKPKRQCCNTCDRVVDTAPTPTEESVTYTPPTEVETEVEIDVEPTKSVEVAEESVGTSEVVYFEIGKSQPNASQRATLETIAEHIKANPTVVYRVEGYADASTGGAVRNQILSLERARNTLEILVREYGIDYSQLRAVGRGGVHVDEENLSQGRYVKITTM